MGPSWTDDGEFGRDLDPVSQEAIAWFAMMRADEVAASDRAAFRAWLRRDQRHEAAYRDVERLWSGASELPIVKARRRAARLGVTRRALGKAAIAATVGGGAWMASERGLLADYSTGAGERRTVTLDDNSRVELSASTAVSVDFDTRSRLVTLHRGQAFFSVAPDATRPFVVAAAAGRIVGAGASFDVDRLDDDVRVTIVEREADVRLAERAVRLRAGSQLVYGRDDIGAPYDVDPAAELAWREGRLVFVSRPFGNVIASLNRWRRGALIVTSPALAMRPVTLVVDLAKSSDILATLEDALPIRIVSVTPYLTLIFAA
jgi:transmembrane sensor